MRDSSRTTGSVTRRSTLRGRLYEDTFVHSLPALLRYEDKNSMAFSVESRVPFLDPRLVEYIFSLPPEAIIGGGWNKRVMREALPGILPEKIRRRRWKVGFTTPEMAWLIARKDIVNDIFDSDSFNSRPYFDAAAVRERLRAHLRRRGRRDAGDLAGAEPGDLAAGVLRQGSNRCRIDRA